MASQLSLIVCSNFEREVRSLSGLPEFRNVMFTPLNVECDLVEAAWTGLEETVQSCRKDGHSVCLVGSYCLNEAAKKTGLEGSCLSLQKGQCLEWVLDKDVLDPLLQEESLLLLPGWLKRWEAFIEKKWSGDQKRAQASFREQAKKIVLLDTGVYPKVEADLRSFARFLKLPAESFPVGVGHFRLNLSHVVLSWRLERETESVEDRLAGLRRQMTDYARIGHLLASVSKVQSEEDAMSGILEIFRVLLAPQKIAFHPAPGFANMERPEGSPQDRILSLNADYAWAEDKSGFFLRVAHGRELLGLLEVMGLSAEDRREHDLSLSLALARIAGLAQANARAFQALQEERGKFLAVEAALKASEERMRSVFEGASVGLYRSTPSGQIVDANPALARLLGYPDIASLKSVNSWDLHLNPGDREYWQSLLEGSHYVETFETQLRRRDGTIIWVRDSARAVKDGRGQVVFYDGTVEDITKKKQTDSALSWNLQVRTSLADVSSRLLSRTPIEEMSAVLLEHARRLTSSLTCFVGYVDRQNGRLVPAAVTPDAQDLLSRHPELNGSAHDAAGLWSWVLQNRKPILTNLPTLDPRFKKIPEWHFPVGQFLAAPAVMADGLVGLIVVANSANLYSERDLEAVERLAALYAIAVHRMRTEEELRELSLIDDMTRLSNRRGFMTLAEQQLKNANRSRKELFLLYADLDDLKAVNDTFGHREGDRAIVDTAAALREAFRESDIIARIGGDEFVVLAIDAGEGKSETLIKRVEEKLADRNGRPDRKYPLSLSIGIARYDPDRPCSVQDLISRADKRMYKAKSGKKFPPAQAA